MRAGTADYQWGAGEGRARRTFLPSVFFAFFAAAPFAVLLCAAVRQGPVVMSAFQIVLPVYLAGFIPAAAVTAGLIRCMALAEAEGKTERKLRCYDTGIIFLLAAAALITLAGAAFSHFAPELFNSSDTEIRAAVFRWIPGLLLTIIPGSLCFFWELLLFEEGGEKQAASVCAGITVLLVILRPSLFWRGSATTGTCVILASFWLAGGALCRILLGRRIGSHRISVEPACIKTILTFGKEDAVFPAAFALMAACLNIVMLLSGKSRSIPLYAAVLFCMGSVFVLGEGLSLAAAPMQRVFHAEKNERGILGLMGMLLVPVLVSASVLMFFLFFAAAPALGFLTGEQYASSGELAFAVRCFSPFAVPGVMNHWLSRYFMRNGEKKTGVLLAALSGVILPFSGALVSLFLPTDAAAGVCAGAGMAAASALYFLYVSLRGRAGEESWEEWLMPDHALLERQYAGSCPSDPGSVRELLDQADAFLAAKKVAKHQRIHSGRRTEELGTAVLRHCGSSGEYSVDITLTIDRNVILIFRDDAPPKDQTGPVPSFRMYAHSRELLKEKQDMFSAVFSENRTILRL